MKNLVLFIVAFVLMFASVSAQKGGTTFTSFIDYQKSFPRPYEAFKKKEDTLQKQFAEKKLSWPAKYIYLRSFKYDSQLEVWVKNEIDEKFKLFKTYKVCAMAGTLGPKRMEGDYQVPEGFYYINVFNPKSNYHLSLGLNYPNASDKVLSDSYRPGGEIYIHGSCVTVGCIPVTDSQMEELYVLSLYAKTQGQDFIPVHIFPIKYSVRKSLDYFDNLIKEDMALKKFSSPLEDAFEYFEEKRQLPVIMIDDKGDYIVNNAPPKKNKFAMKSTVAVVRTPTMHRVRNIPDIAEAVHQWPEFPGGGQSFLDYLTKVGNQMQNDLPEELTKVYLKIEFVIDRDGTAVNFKILKGVNGAFDDDLITNLEKMPTWKPGTLQGKIVAKKMVQSFSIEKN